MAVMTKQEHEHALDVPTDVFFFFFFFSGDLLPDSEPHLLELEIEDPIDATTDVEA